MPKRGQSGPKGCRSAQSGQKGSSRDGHFWTPNSGPPISSTSPRRRPRLPAGERIVGCDQPAKSAQKGVKKRPLFGTLFGTLFWTPRDTPGWPLRIQRGLKQTYPFCTVLSKISSSVRDRFWGQIGAMDHGGTPRGYLPMEGGFRGSGISPTLRNPNTICMATYA